jgi:hypothetical protein
MNPSYSPPETVDKNAEKLTLMNCNASSKLKIGLAGLDLSEGGMNDGKDTGALGGCLLGAGFWGGLFSDVDASGGGTKSSGRGACRREVSDDWNMQRKAPKI